MPPQMKAAGKLLAALEQQLREPGTGWTISDETKKQLDDIDKQTVVSPRTS
jgi:predicted secreted protein